MALTRTENSFIELRKQYIEKRFSNLNPVQRSAVLKTEGPLLILAGAGSGKTTVVVNRICCLLEFGNAYESDELARPVTDKDVEELRNALETGELTSSIRPLMKTGVIKPWNILAITFTNKAAGELKNRIEAAVGSDGLDVFASTFHSACVRFLRSDAELLGFPRSFTIYDTDDSKRVMKEIMKDLSIDDKLFPLNPQLSKIGRYKDSMTSPEEVTATAKEYRDRVTAKLYSEYQKRLKQAGAFDFDDLIYFTVRLLREHEEVREKYQRRFKYIMVDEYQDTSYAQSLLVRLLTGSERNLCVVGDDDQSIYRFRGATIENILGFENTFSNTKTIRLEQNYRSTSHILNSANSVIKNNKGRKGKTLWTNNGDGDKIKIICSDTEQEEAELIAKQITDNLNSGIRLKNQAVLYRMNAQSNAIENYFARAGIPYRVIGGQRFFDRAEIKDMIAYMCIVSNPADDLRLQRIINKPSRKIGAATIGELSRIADGLGVPMLEVIRDADDFETLSKASNALKNFYRIYQKLCDTLENGTLEDFVRDIIDSTGYRAMLTAEGDEGETRLQNVEELISTVKQYEQENEDGDLDRFLEQVALVSDIDSYDENTDAVVMMTLHSAKGLEFDCVYIAGMEEGIFPGELSRFDERETEEERRLCYVGITRAKKKLTLSYSKSRMLFGQTRRNRISRFLDELPPECVELPVEPERKIERTDYRSRNSGSVTLGSQASSIRQPKPAVKNNAVYMVGDRVNHRVFGDGTILSVTELSSDMLLEIDFDTRGVKKTMANYAPLKKL